MLEEGRRGQASGTTNLVSSPQRACTTARPIRNQVAGKRRATGTAPANIDSRSSSVRLEAVYRGGGPEE